jgi:hypothetical protein
MITMVLGGLWHGAAWTFVAWGGLHGFYLLINHFWRNNRQRLGLFRTPPLGASVVSGALTFFAVVVAWVFFRAETFSSALHILSGMASLNKVPEIVYALLNEGPKLILEFGGLWFMVAVGAVVAFLCPNSNEVCSAVGRTIAATGEGESAGPLFPTAVAYGALLGIAIVSMGRISQFLYFQF